MAKVSKDPTTASSTTASPASTNSQENTSKLNFEPRIEFTQTQESTVLASYFYGYFITNFVGCLLVFKFGPRRTMIVCLSGATLFTFLIPLATYITSYEYYLVVTCRILIGIFCGPLYTVIHELLARWAPVEERTNLTVLTHSGNIIGLILTFSTGALTDISQKAWEYYIYFAGVLGVISLVLWIVFVYDYAWEHPFISEEEKEMITKSLYPDGIPKKEPISSIPFKQIFTSIPLATTCIAQVGNNYILYTFLTNLTKYLKKYYELSPKNASLISIIPFFVNFVFQFIASQFTGLMRIRFPKKPITFIRKIDCCIGFGCSALFLIPAGFMGEDGIILSVLFLTLSMGFIAFNQPGFFTAMIDISPKHAAISMGIANTFGSISGFISPLMVNIFESNYGKAQAWQFVFISTAGLSLFCGLVWIIFGTSELQHWKAKSSLLIDSEFKNEKFPIKSSDSENTDLISQTDKV